MRNAASDNTGKSREGVEWAESSVVQRVCLRRSDAGGRKAMTDVASSTQRAVVRWRSKEWRCCMSVCTCAAVSGGGLSVSLCARLRLALNGRPRVWLMDFRRRASGGVKDVHAPFGPGSETGIRGGWRRWWFVECLLSLLVISGQDKMLGLPPTPATDELTSSTTQATRPNNEYFPARRRATRSAACRSEWEEARS